MYIYIYSYKQNNLNNLTLLVRAEVVLRQFFINYFAHNRIHMIVNQRKLYTHHPSTVMAHNFNLKFLSLFSSVLNVFK